MKVFQDKWHNRRFYSFRRVGFENKNAFGPAWLTIQRSEDKRVTDKDYKTQLIAIWKLWGNHTIALTNENYDIL